LIFLILSQSAGTMLGRKSVNLRLCNLTRNQVLPKTLFTSPLCFQSQHRLFPTTSKDKETKKQQYRLVRQIVGYGALTTASSAGALLMIPVVPVSLGFSVAAAVGIPYCCSLSEVLANMCVSGGLVGLAGLSGGAGIASGLVVAHSAEKCLDSLERLRLKRKLNI
jgi:hypothetical protein